MGCEKDKYRICIHFPKNAPSLNSPDGRGLSERVSREEAIEALKYSDKQGLIHKIGHSRQNFCNCCTCCCTHHYKAEKYEKMFKGSFLRTPYIIEVDEEKCKGCGLCMKKCQFGALSLKDGKITLDSEKCWGCGVCRVNCRAEALRIVKRG